MRCFLLNYFYQYRCHWHTVPSPRGGFGGLSPPNKAPSPRKLKYETLYKLVEVLSNLNVKPSLHERKAPPPIDNTTTQFCWYNTTTQFWTHWNRNTLSRT